VSQLPAHQRASISFKLANASIVEVPIEEAAQLGSHLAMFGPDEEMQRSRLLAEKIATAASLAARDATAILYLTDSQRADVGAALQAMRDDRAKHCSSYRRYASPIQSRSVMTSDDGRRLLVTRSGNAGAQHLRPG
jgi:hypothetical protein